MIIGNAASMWHTFQRPKAEVNVKCIPNKHLSSVDGTIHITVANVRHKNIKFNLPNVLLDDGRIFETYIDGMSEPSKLPLDYSKINFPYLLIPRDTFELQANSALLACLLKHNGYCGEVKIWFQFFDGIHKGTCKSGEYSISIDKTLKYTQSTFSLLLREENKFKC